MSSPQLHIIDPNGDVDLLIDEQSTPLIDASELTDNATQTSVTTAIFGNGGQIQGNSQPPSEGSTNASAKGSQQNVKGSDSLIVRASSKHLAFASQYFKTLFYGRFKESKELSDEGRVQTRVPRSSQSREAVLLFLNAVHGSTEHIPLKISFSLYFELAVLINFFDASAQKFKFYTDTWDRGNAELSVTPDKSSWTKLKQIACVAWVFKKTELFEAVTREMIVRCDQRNIEFSSIPFPPRAIAKIQADRMAYLRMVFRSFDCLLHDPGYRGRVVKQKCSSTDPLIVKSCTALRIGLLTLALQENEWLGLTLKPDSLATGAFAGDIRSIETWMTSFQEDQNLGRTIVPALNDNGKLLGLQKHDCSLRNWMLDLHSAIAYNIKGLKLADH